MFVGRVRSAQKVYSIYYYYFINYETMHGHHRVIILKENCDYVGSYILDNGPSRTSGADVIFNVPKDWGNVIHFKNGRPPKEVWIDGTIAGLIR